MSSFITLAKRPGGTEYEECWYLDDYYGPRKYAVQFPDELVFPAEQCERIPKEEEFYALNQLKKEKARQTDHIADASKKVPLFTQGQLDSYATECLETERKRIYTALSRTLKHQEFEVQVKSVKACQVSHETLSEILQKVILGNRK